MIQPGSRLAHYEIVSALGKGGMGEVWRARDTKLGREVAIKTLPEEFANDAERLARFEREAKLLASLNHPNIAGIFGFEEDAGTRFLTLELVEGPTLADQLAQGAIPIEDALKIALQIAEALESAHEKGVIHRDLKPSNVKLTPDGNVKVLDFGLAKAFEGEASDANVLNSPTLSMAATQQGLILGTAAYMSPEQAKGLPADKRADVFAFGCVLYEMLTGRQAFEGDLATEIMAHVISQEPDYSHLPTDLHPDIERLLRRCLAKKPVHRYRDIGDVRYEIAQWLDHPEAFTRPVVSDVMAAPTAPSKGVWIGVVVTAALLAGVAGWLLRTPPPPEPRVVVRFDHELANGVNFRNTGRKAVAITSDGRHIAYNASDGVHLLSLDSFESRIIPGTESARTNLTFSPDGQWLGYHIPGGALEKMPVNGGAAVVLAVVDSNPQGVSWDTDDTLVYSDSGSLMSVSANGGVPDPLFPDGNNRALPQLLPGGTAVLYSTGEEVLVQALDASEPRALFAGSDPRYVSTGHVVYVRDGTIYAHTFDLGRLDAVGGPVPLVEDVLGGGNPLYHYAISDSGTLVYIPNDSGSSASLTMVWVDRDGNETPIDTLPAADYGNPRLSPSGDRLLVHAGDDLSIYELGNGRRTPVTTDGTADARYYAWRPNGEDVAYTSSRSGNDEVWIQAVDGSSAAIRLSQAEGTADVESFSPTGDTLAFHVHAGGGGTDIFTISLEGESIEDAVPSPDPLLTTEFGENQTQFSPDGRYMAYVSARVGGPQIYIRPFPGPGPTETVSIDGGVELIWARNGEIFFRHPETHALMAVEVETDPVLVVGDPVLVFEADRYVGYTGASPSARYDVSADGQRFLMLRDSAANSAADSRPRINVVVDWFEELRERVPVD